MAIEDIFEVTRRVGTPIRAEARAASVPACPPPTTITSTAPFISGTSISHYQLSCEQKNNMHYASVDNLLIQYKRGNSVIMQIYSKRKGLVNTKSMNKYECVINRNVENVDAFLL